MAIKETEYFVNMDQGGSISLRRLMPSQVIGYPIVIAHGTIFNGEAALVFPP